MANNCEALEKLEEYDLAMARLESERAFPKNKLPIVERRTSSLCKQEALSSAARALSSLWIKR